MKRHIAAFVARWDQATVPKSAMTWRGTRARCPVRLRRPGEKRLAAVREREAERRREADRQTREGRERKTEQAAADDGDG